MVSARCFPPSALRGIAIGPVNRELAAVNLTAKSWMDGFPKPCVVHSQKYTEQRLRSLMILSIMSLSLPFLFVCIFCFVIKSFGCALNVISMGARATRAVNVRIKYIYRTRWLSAMSDGRQVSCSRLCRYVMRIVVRRSVVVGARQPIGSGNGKERQRKSHN